MKSARELVKRDYLNQALGIFCTLIVIMVASVFIAPNTSAASKCEVISGTGRDIGDEIACGTEHFYVVKSGANETRMLAKYNLMTNGRCDLYKTDRAFSRTEDYTNYLATLLNVSREKAEELILGKGHTENIYDFIELKNDSSGQTVAIKYCTKGYYESGKTYLQDEKAIAFRGNVDDLQFPYEGLFQFPIDKNDAKERIQPEDVFKVDKVYEDKPISFGNETEIVSSDISLYLQDYSVKSETGEGRVMSSYAQYLKDYGVKSDDVSKMTLSEFDQLLKDVSGNNLDYSRIQSASDWELVTGVDGKTETMNMHYKIVDFKNQIPDKYKWIYSTTYWLDTMIDDNREDTPMSPMRLFVITLGELCMEHFCYAPSVGLRPSVVISNDNINYTYKIKTETDGNGSIEVVESAKGGELIKFKVAPNKGYILKKLKIISDAGAEIIFNKEDIIKDSDGFVLALNNNFTMPSDNVTIVANWGIIEFAETSETPKNPETYSSSPMLFFVVFGILTAGVGLIGYRLARKISA